MTRFIMSEENEPERDMTPPEVGAFLVGLPAFREWIQQRHANTWGNVDVKMATDFVCEFCGVFALCDLGVAKSSARKLVSLVIGFYALDFDRLSYLLVDIQGDPA